MTTYYVRSTNGASGDGLSWASAKLTIKEAVDIPLLPGDTVFVSKDHAESATAAKNWTFPGTPNQPNRVICVADDSANPTTLAATASLPGGTTTTTTPRMEGSVHLYGLQMTYNVATTIGFMNSGTTDAVEIFEKCTLNVITTSSSTYPYIGNSGSTNAARSRMLWLDTDLRLAGGGQRLVLYQELTWRGGALLPGGALSYLLAIGAQGRSCPVLIEGVDLIGLDTMSDLVLGSSATGRVMFRNCKLPANWAGNLVQGAIDPGLRVEMHNCDSGATNYALRVAAFSGTIRSETAIVKTGGASDGSTGVSWKIETNANPTPGSLGLETPEFIKWNTAVGTELTVSVDVLADSGTLTNAEVWLDVQYMGASSSPKGSFVSSRATLVAATVPVSVATWPAGGARTPQRLSVKFTPQKAGAIHCRVVLAKPNASVFVDPKILVS